MFSWLKDFFSKTEKPDVGLGTTIYSNLHKEIFGYLHMMFPNTYQNIQ